jgi:hypothetical protein
MSKVFLAVSNEGKLSLGSPENRARFADFLKANNGMRFRIEPITPESKKQRNFFEGAVVPLIAYYQEGFDHTNSHDCKVIREWLKLEFHGEFRVVAGKSIKMAKSTKGELNRGFLEAVLDWAGGEGYQTELLLPVDYKLWKDTIYPYGGPDNYIDYLLEIGKLRPRELSTSKRAPR